MSHRIAARRSRSTIRGSITKRSTRSPSGWISSQIESPATPKTRLMIVWSSHRTTTTSPREIGWSV
jgi:hypothetical protein